jgi:hypothetical protein
MRLLKIDLIIVAARAIFGGGDAEAGLDVGVDVGLGSADILSAFACTFCSKMSSNISWFVWTLKKPRFWDEMCDVSSGRTRPQCVQKCTPLLCCVLHPSQMITIVLRDI